MDDHISAILQAEMLRWVNKHATTKAMLIGVFAKRPTNQKDYDPPEWMTRPVFGGQSWFELGVHERKYYVRKNIDDMKARGALLTKEHTTLYGNRQVRLKAGTVLDLLAAIDAECG